MKFKFEDKSEYYKYLNSELSNHSIILIKPDKATLNFDLKKSLVLYFLNFNKDQVNDYLILSGETKKIIDVEKIVINKTTGKVLVDIKVV